MEPAKIWSMGAFYAPAFLNGLEVDVTSVSILFLIFRDTKMYFVSVRKFSVKKYSVWFIERFRNPVQAYQERVTKF